MFPSISLGPSGCQQLAWSLLWEAEDALPKIQRNPFPNLTVQVLHCYTPSASLLPSNTTSASHHVETCYPPTQRLRTPVLSLAMETHSHWSTHEWSAMNVKIPIQVWILRCIPCQGNKCISRSYGIRACRNRGWPGSQQSLDSWVIFTTN